MKRIAVVTKDPGGAANILPILNELWERKTPFIEVLTDEGSWFSQNVPRGIPFRAVNDSPSDYLRDILITSMDSNMRNTPDGRNLGRDIAMAMPRGKIVVAITDGWDGAQINPDVWAKRECRPDYVIVNDEIGAQMVLEANPWLGRDCIKILGWPALDALADRDLARRHREARVILNIPDEEFVVMYCGQLPYTGEGLHKLVVALSQQSEKVTLIARPHPRMGPDPAFTAERARWKEALELFDRNGLGTRVDSGHIKDGNEVLAAADLAVSLNSNMLRDAAIMGIDCICIRDHIPEKDRTRFPLIELRCAADPKSQRHLTETVARATEKGLDMDSARKDAFRLDGQNTKRVADFITTLL